MHAHAHTRQEQEVTEHRELLTKTFVKCLLKFPLTSCVCFEMMATLLQLLDSSSSLSVGRQLLVSMVTVQPASG